MSFRALLSRSPVPLGTMIGEFDTPGIGHIAKAAGLAALVATHNLDLAGQMDRVLTLRDGHLEVL